MFLEDLMRANQLKANEIERLEELKFILKPAFLRGEKKCVMCGYCCHRKTCIPTPNELKKIAEFFRMTPQKLIKKYFAIDIYKGIYHVRPIGINIKDLKGKFIPADRTYGEGKCIFLDKKNRCKIQEVKPKQAKSMKCWVKTKPFDVLKYWKGNQLLKQFGIDGGKLEVESEE